MLKAQFVLQGTESDIEKIEKEITEVSMHKEIVAFNLNGEIKKGEA